LYYVTVKMEFAGAHQLRGYKGKCENLHGHNWKVEAVVRGRELDKTGMLVDFVELKARMNDLIGALDHRNLNELEPFTTINPSAENIARYLYDGLAAAVPPSVKVDRVTVYETDRCAATYASE